MRAIFWPGVLGWTLLGVWISTLRYRVRILEEKKQVA
jgi:heme exporter protein C